MTTIRLSAKSEESMHVVFTGSGCEVDDFRMALVQFANQWVRDKDQGRAEKKPCGCKDAKDQA